MNIDKHTTSTPKVSGLRWPYAQVIHRDFEAGKRVGQPIANLDMFDYRL